MKRINKTGIDPTQKRKVQDGTKRKHCISGARKMAPATMELFEAVRAQNLSRVKAMVNDRASVNVVDKSDVSQPTLLLVACELGDARIVKVLLRSPKGKLDVNQGDKRGRRPIWWAATHGNRKMTEMLLYGGKTKADVNCIDEVSGCAPLLGAILSKSVEVCRLLVREGADVNLRRLWGTAGESEASETPLIKAVQQGCLDICELLLNSLCKINAPSVGGLTALHYAVGYRRHAVCTLLLREGSADVHAKSRAGVTPMTVAISERLPGMVKLLAEFAYDIDRPFDWGETPLEMAIRCHAEGCALTLVHYGCQLSSGFLSGSGSGNNRSRRQSYFFAAACEGLTDLVQFMSEIQPKFLSEDWVRQRQPPLALHANPDFCRRLFEEAAAPKPLTLLCKSKISQYLGRGACTKIDKLPLPRRLTTFIKYDDQLDKKIYREKTLSMCDCPYDCLPYCPRRQCPVLDFSDSASD